MVPVIMMCKNVLVYKEVIRRKCQKILIVNYYFL